MMTMAMACDAEPNEARMNCGRRFLKKTFPWEPGNTYREDGSQSGAKKDAQRQTRIKVETERRSTYKLLFEKNFNEKFTMNIGNFMVFYFSLFLLLSNGENMKRQGNGQQSEFNSI